MPTTPSPQSMPTDPAANALLGTVLAQLGRPEEAVAFLSQAARLGPDEPETLNNLALGAVGRTREM